MEELERSIALDQFYHFFVCSRRQGLSQEFFHTQFLTAHPWCLGSSINVSSVTDAFKDATASFCNHCSNTSCLKRIKARGALHTFHSSWTPEHLSTTAVPNIPDALEYTVRQGQVRAGIIYQEPTTKRVFVLFCKDHWHKKRRGWTISNGPSWRQSMPINLDPTT
ncbi:hypothetical protein TNCV_3285531 [Trichonephila clavipes]|nr:hypothetical protein TNCV_3285531 [Trichonephila clavipes]